jgi:hypothetical protein
MMEVSSIADNHMPVRNVRLCALFIMSCFHAWILLKNEAFSTLGQPTSIVQRATKWRVLG